MKPQHITNTIIFAVSVGVSVLLSEVAFRAVLNTVDFLQPTIVEDDILGHRVSPSTGGHDKLGFRNTNVPERVEIVAVGDSMTYGVAAIQAMSWPSQVAQQTGLSVYNLGLGGYGPLHYLELIRSYAFSFEPKQIVIGIYLGNDLMDAYNLAYGSSRWETYRALDSLPTGQPTNSVVVNAPADNDGRLFGGLRQWLSQRSVLYAAIARSPVGDLVRESEASDSGRLSLEHSGAPTYFDLQGMAITLDLADARIAEGKRLTKTALREIASLCQLNGVQLLVLFVPSKELVYSQLLTQQELDGSTRNSLEKILKSETEARAELMGFLADQGIGIADPLGALRDAVHRGTVIYPSNDSHPNGQGYELIADTVAQRLEI